MPSAGTVTVLNWTKPPRAMTIQSTSPPAESHRSPRAVPPDTRSSGLGGRVMHTGGGFGDLGPRMTQFGHIVFGGIASASYQPGGAPGVPVPPKPLIPPPPLPLLLPLPPLPLSVVSGDPPPSSLEDPPELLLELEELLELELDPPELDPPVSPPLDEELELVAPEPPELELLVAPAPAGVPVPGAVVLEQAA